MFAGIDLTSSAKRASGVAVIDQDMVIRYLAPIRTDKEIVRVVHTFSSLAVAIDSPLGFPKGMCCLEESCTCIPVSTYKGRQCERTLSWMGISSYYTTKKSIIKPMIYRARELRKLLHPTPVIEYYPYATKVVLFGKPIPKKSTPEGEVFMREKLSKIIPGLEYHHLDHDLCDALLGAYTSFLYSSGMYKAVGDPVEECIILPRLDYHAR